jgi:cytochrome c oxidase subunit 2
MNPNENFEANPTITQGIPIVPEQASEFAVLYDWHFLAISALTVFFTVLVLALIIFFTLRYREGNKVDRTNPHHEHLQLELAWTFIPLVLAIGIFFWGVWLYANQRVPPANAQEIYIIGKQWMWHAQHMNGVRENNTLHVPVGRPVQLTMISQDVIHAFYIPEFRTQFMVVPGRYTTMYFTPTKPGEFKLLCTMHCGTEHSMMVGKVVALNAPEFDAWLAQGGNMPTTRNLTLAQQGEQLFNQIGCANCHGATNSMRAPTLVGLASSTVELADGTTVVADDAYLRESILNPWNKLTRGYDRTMPEYAGTLTEEQVFQLVSYIKSLRTEVPAGTAGQDQPAGAAPALPVQAPGTALPTANN